MSGKWIDKSSLLDAKDYPGNCKNVSIKNLTCLDSENLWRRARSLKLTGWSLSFCSPTHCLFLFYFLFLFHFFHLLRYKTKILFNIFQCYLHQTLYLFYQIKLDKTKTRREKWTLDARCVSPDLRSIISIIQVIKTVLLTWNWNEVLNSFKVLLLFYCIPSYINEEKISYFRK